MLHQPLGGRFFAMLFLTVCTSASWASCQLPVPDGSDERPSEPNLHGRITSIVGSVVRIRQIKTGRVVPVLLPAKPEIYSAFGGDASLEELAAGQTAWVWFNDCVWPTKGQPTAAYFRIYSKNPNDQP